MKRIIKEPLSVRIARSVKDWAEYRIKKYEHPYSPPYVLSEIDLSPGFIWRVVKEAYRINSELNKFEEILKNVDEEVN